MFGGVVAVESMGLSVGLVGCVCWFVGVMAMG